MSWMKMNKIRSLADSFRNALRGLLFCVKNERNFRIHMVAAAAVFRLSLFYKLSAGEYAVLVLAVGGVFASEMVNTAVEKAVDMISPAYHPMAKVVKDVCAGAVLVSALAACGAGTALFWKPLTLLAILGRYLSDFPAFAMLTLCAGAAAAFIFIPPAQIYHIIKNKKRK